MLRWSQMVDPVDVLGPRNGVRILRSGYAESEVRQLPSGLDQQSLKGQLTVVAVGAEIGQLPLFRPVELPIGFGVDGAVERSRHGRAILALDAWSVGPPVNDR